VTYGSLLVQSFSLADHPQLFQLTVDFEERFAL
jgi:hypothetical protein